MVLLFWCYFILYLILYSLYSFVLFIFFYHIISTFHSLLFILRQTFSFFLFKWKSIFSCFCGSILQYKQKLLMAIFRNNIKGLSFSLYCLSLLSPFVLHLSFSLFFFRNEKPTNFILIYFTILLSPPPPPLSLYSYIIHKHLSLWFFLSPHFWCLHFFTHEKFSF